MELNLFTITYLFLRLAPFLIVCFFVFASFFNQDFKGLVYLVGLILTSVIIQLVTVTPGISSFINKYFKLQELKGETCNAFEMNIYGFKTTNDLPMGQVVLGFTYAYLMTIIDINQIYSANIPTIIFFPCVIIFDILWNVSNSCNSYGMLFLALLLGCLGGYGWAQILHKTKNDKLLYFNFVGGNDVSCSRPAKQSFKCSMKLISQKKD